MNNKFRILKKQLNNMLSQSVSSARKDGSEICGLLIDNGYFIELIRCKNKSKKGGGFQFYFNEINLLKKAVGKLDHEIIGTFHSHPYYLAEPGESDIANALDDSYMLIFDALDKEACLWHIKKLKKRKIKFILI